MFKKLALILGLATAASTAQATTININLINGYVNGSAPLTQRVDLSSILADYTITGATFAATLRDDADVYQTTHLSGFGSYSQYRVRYIGNRTYRYYERSRFRETTHPVEQADLYMFGGRVDYARTFADVSRVYQRTLQSSCLDMSATYTRCERDVERSRSVRYERFGNNGQLSQTFTQYWLDQMAVDGFFDYSIRASTGDFNVRSARLTLTVEALPAAAPVPLPAGALLLLSALGVAGVASRRRRMS
ncbi:hypothetical protein A8B78_11675 [Jannaschia sp. EhC01]|nr:hypothetical protein A8B78_11675 [Jannaschia sp. EhC01]